MNIYNNKFIHINIVNITRAPSSTATTSTTKIVIINLLTCTARWPRAPWSSPSWPDWAPSWAPPDPPAPWWHPCTDRKPSAARRTPNTSTSWHPPQTWPWTRNRSGVAPERTRGQPALVSPSPAAPVSYGRVHICIRNVRIILNINKEHYLPLPGSLLELFHGPSSPWCVRLQLVLVADHPSLVQQGLVHLWQLFREPDYTFATN